ncbi:MAG: hypothetical protein Q9M34_00720 [Sulfurimonas sp.]|nr:hypothetical protein [Sulfurimonas sp.]
MKTTIFAYISISGVLVALLLGAFAYLNHKRALENDLLYKMHVMADDIVKHRYYDYSEDNLKKIFSVHESYHHVDYLESVRYVKFSFKPKTQQEEQILSVVKKLPNGKTLTVYSSYEYINQEISKVLGHLLLVLSGIFFFIIGVLYIVLQKLFSPLKCLVDYCHNETSDKAMIEKCAGSYEVNALKEAIFTLQQRNNILCKEKQKIFKEAAHEIKTPIAILKARLSLFETSDMTKSDFVENAKNDISSISNKLRELIFLKEIEQDIQKAKESVSMQNQCEMMQQLFRPILEKKKLKMISNLEEDFNLFIHKEANGRVMRAIFENIFMHTENGTTINTFIDPKKHTLKIVNEIATTSSEILFSSHIGTKIIERLAQKLEYKYVTYEKGNLFYTEITFEGQG